MKLYIYASDTDSGLEVGHSLTLEGITEQLHPLLSVEARETFAAVLKEQGAAAALSWFEDNGGSELFGDDLDSFTWEEVELPDKSPVEADSQSV